MFTVPPECPYFSAFESSAYPHSIRMINGEYGFLREKDDEFMKEF